MFKTMSTAEIEAYLTGNGFENSSWGNDICPSFINVKARVQVWLDYEDKEQREDPTATRFALCQLDDYEQFESEIINSDNFQDIIEKLEALQ